MDQEVRLTRDELVRDIVQWLRIARQKQPALLRNLAAAKDDRGYPDHDRTSMGMEAFAAYLADKFLVSGKRVIRGVATNSEGVAMRSAAEVEAADRRRPT